jgi:hypothetical protein
LPPDLAGEVNNWRNISPDTGPDALVFPSERGTYLSRDNFLRRNIQKKLDEIGLGWVNFQVLRRTQAVSATRRASTRRWPPINEGTRSGSPLTRTLRAILKSD